MLFTEFNGAYGNMTVIDHGKIGGLRITTMYAHQSAVGVKPGDPVVKGQAIGVIGSTGYSPGRTCTSRCGSTASRWTRGRSSGRQAATKLDAADLVAAACPAGRLADKLHRLGRLAVLAATSRDIQLTGGPSAPDASRNCCWAFPHGGGDDLVEPDLCQVVCSRDSVQILIAGACTESRMA